MDQQTLNNALERGKAVAGRFDGIEYARLVETVGGFRRGTAVLSDGSVIPGYPSIGRVQSLAAGLQRHYQGPFWAEEKMDGFNVRIVRDGERTVAFSRGGFICAFSTDRLPDLLDTSVLDDHPELILCVEIAGPDNPYLEGHPPQVTEDVQLFVFDMMRKGEDGFLPQAEKMALLERYGLPSTRIFGRFRPDDIEALEELILQLDAEGSEGLVFKGESDGGRAKYVTGRSSVADIEICSDQLLDLPPEYFTNRLLRLGLFVAEHGQAGDAELERSLGRAFIDGVTRAVARSRGVGRVGRRFRCRFRERRHAEMFMQHIKATGGQRVLIDEAMPLQEKDGYWLLEFERVLERMTGTLANTLAGASQYD